MINHTNNLKPIYYIPIHGTWAIDEEETAWWRATGDFAKYAKRFNIVQLEYHPFIWSSDLNGAWYNFLSSKVKHSDWLAGGWSLVYYIDKLPVESRNLIVHSHGLQVALYAASFGLKINNMISICSPIRNDMINVTKSAKENINKWLHIYSNSDRTQWFGQFGDGRLFGSRRTEFADKNVKLEKIGHSELLKLEGRMDLWNIAGWFDFLRGNNNGSSNSDSGFRSRLRDVKSCSE